MPGTDPTEVRIEDEDRLRRFVDRRDAGDAAGAGAAWRELVEVSFDRVAALVALWSYRRVRLDAAEQEEVVQRAMLSMFERVGATFRGTSMGELHETLKQLVHFRACDVVGEAARRREREDHLERRYVGEDGTERGEHPGEAAEAQRRLGRDAEKDDAADRVYGALDRLGDERRREVLERTLDGVPAAQIAQALGVSMDNLYQLRRRGLLDLRRIMSDMETDA